MDAHEFGTGQVRARVLARGAELCSLRFAPESDRRGAEMLWQAGPAWPRHAPVLFPIVGRLVGDTLNHAGFAGRMTQHGFARDRIFQLTDRDEAGCTFVLADDADTRAAYPFAFCFLVQYRVDGATLTVLPASVGAHPAFRWPLADGIAKDAHRLVFPLDENGSVRRVAGGLLQPDAVPTPVEGRVLALRDALFGHDAIILEHPASTEVRYEAPGTRAPAITVAWSGFSTLGIWSKPADFVCIEPWSGFASPSEFVGEFTDKPGICLIAPGETLTRSLAITLHEGGASGATNRG